MKSIETNCSICNHTSILSYRGPDLFDDNGNKILFRSGCGNCGFTRRLTSQEIQGIINSCR